MSIRNYNSNSGVKWNINSEGFDFVKLRDLEEGMDYPLYGCFISKDHGYGEGAVLISDGFNVNVPERYVDTVKSIMSDAEAISEINSGKAIFRFRTFTSQKYHRTGYSLEFDIK